TPPLFPYPTLFRSCWVGRCAEPPDHEFPKIATVSIAAWTQIEGRRKLLSVVLRRSDDGPRLCRTVWRSVLQNDWRLNARPPLPAALDRRGIGRPRHCDPGHR